MTTCAIPTANQRLARLTTQGAKARHDHQHARIASTSRDRTKSEAA
jgi:hypothetical protein